MRNCLSFRVNRLVGACVAFVCTLRAKMVSHVKDPMSIISIREGLTPCGMETQITRERFERERERRERESQTERNRGERDGARER